jgi:hypothetical protein
LSNKARIFFNVQTGVLEFDTLVQVTMPNQEFDIIYDMFPYQNTIIVAGRIKGASSVVTLSQGKLDLTKNIIDLNPNFKTTGIQSGAVLVDQSTMTYHELDIQAKTLGYF